MENLNQPNKSGFLKVSEIHQIYYEDCGNPNGEVILFLHGGPGMGFSDLDKRFFDFKINRVLFFDQRGSSRSIPFGCIEENTTGDLVKDINQLLDYLAIEKVLIFGGSWGTTLGLVFAIQNPSRVRGLLLRGVFLANKESIDYYLEGGVKKEFPEVWKRFSQNVPSDSKCTIAEYYSNKMINGNPNEKRFYAYEWSFYEISIFKKNITEQEVDAILNRIPFESLSIMESYYLKNQCFISENYILENINKLEQIPIKIVHGKQDAICPVSFVIELDSKLKNSELYVLQGGHSDFEPEIENKLIEIIGENLW
ncbi:MAG: prolyl aminopeptidase [Flavobacteriaceae bacterium]|nr:MAG: prolyl aminopeptidase [Flavobacteriaceae bacterium]